MRNKIGKISRETTTGHWKSNAIYVRNSTEIFKRISHPLHNQFQTAGEVLETLKQKLSVYSAHLKR